MPTETQRTARRALPIGIEYARNMKLSGPARDVKRLASLLRKKYGFNDDEILVLTDVSETGIDGIEHRPATKQGILVAVNRLVSNTQPNSKLLLFFSGHGAQTYAMPSQDKSVELNGLDECIVPSDYRESGNILDDELHVTVVEALDKTAHLTAIFDCSHSGSILDLPFVYDFKKEEFRLSQATEGKGKIATDAKQLMSTLVKTGKRKDLIGAAKSVGGQLLRQGTRRLYQTESGELDCGQVVLISACKDNETTIHSQLGKRENRSLCGAVTDSLVKLILESTDQSFASVLRTIREDVQDRNQKPQLSCSTKFDISTKFFDFD